MNKTKINAEIVAHSLSPQGDELISVLCTFPRIILAEVNTHRMLSKNTSSSRAIPFNKMVEAVQNNPFIPIAWQRDHKGMQGTKYITDEIVVKYKQGVWLQARNRAIDSAIQLNSNLIRSRSADDEGKILEETGVTKQICNRLLEPFMWTTMLITGSIKGWDNFFHLRCPQYEVFTLSGLFNTKSRIEAKNIALYPDEFETFEIALQHNKGQAEIHMMALAESIYDAVNESTPKQLKAGEWHIPFGDKIDDNHLDIARYKINGKNPEHAHIERIDEREKQLNQLKLSIATARTARLSYMTFDGEIDYIKDIQLHDKLLLDKHMSPFEHCAKVMSNDEYAHFYKGLLVNREFEVEGYDENYLIGSSNDEDCGWCNNFKGFIPLRYFIDNKIEL